MQLLHPANVLAAALFLGLSPGLGAPAFAQEGQDGESKDAPKGEEVSALQMEWNITEPDPAISALSEECEKRFAGKAHTCDVISHERKKEKPFLRASTSADVILASDFGRRGKIVCQMAVPHSELGHPKILPWLTIVQMQDLFESGRLGSNPWKCAIEKCEDGNCQKLGNPKLLVGSLSAYFSPASRPDDLKASSQEIANTKPRRAKLSPSGQ